jgi:putative flippase GtrA
MQQRSQGSLLERAHRFARGAGVGIAATVADLLALAILVELCALAPTIANVPALLVGAAVQFLGCRHVVFQAGAGSLRRQLGGFVLAEAATLLMNALAFHLLVTLSPAPYALARPLGTFLVFAGFSYPIWHLVFAEKKPQA